MRHVAHLLLVIAVLSSGCTIQYGAGAPMLPPGSAPIRPVVARGYAAFGTRLAAWGTWHQDWEHGALWCPRPDAGGGPSFQPFVSRGRWALSTAPVPGAPEGAPVWDSELRDTWGEITSHHGWWVPVGPQTGWCWVPGDNQTPASVVWRTGDGFVGWAAEPPSWAANDALDDDDVLDWSYTLLGTLCDGSPDQNLLTGDARRDARTATAPASHTGGAKPQHLGPTPGSITTARGLLDGYVAAHPNAIAAASGKPPSSSAATGASTKSSSPKSKTSDDKLAAMDYYNAFRAEPPTGPVGLVPSAHGVASLHGEGGASGTAALVGTSAHGSAALHAASQAHGATPAQTSASSTSSSSASSAPSHGSSSRGRSRSKSRR